MWASARMRRGSGSSVEEEEEEELPPEPEEEDSHLRRSWRRQCGDGVDGAHADAPLSSPSLLCFCVVERADSFLPSDSPGTQNAYFGCVLRWSTVSGRKIL